MTTDLKGKRIAILATDGFEQIELTSPREALEKAGATCVVISPKSGEIQGFKHRDKTGKVKVDLEMSKANAAEFDGVLLPGGVINGDALRIDKNAQKFVQEMERSGKPIMVICHGPWLLVSAGLVKGHTITSWPTLQDDIRNAGGNWQDKEVIRDRNWVSSRKPDDLPAFNKAIVELVAQPAKAARAESREAIEARS
ncbi:MAG TPA: type 1 glutamine amidotransferase domain-containing protein [Thermoanaerobaculia bacterium]|jgi:protease I|nr:type 1 glutamine amidotransferase domain-containing protein [Thermoanaerobaculia bacterium]